MGRKTDCSQELTDERKKSGGETDRTHTDTLNVSVPKSEGNFLTENIMMLIDSPDSYTLVL